MTKRTKKQVVEFEWPEFKNEKERIKAMTKKYANQRIAEAFSAEYKLGWPTKKISDAAENTPTELRVGSIIKAKIKSITKQGVEFESSQKEILLTRTNLFGFPLLKEYIPANPIDVLVMEITPKGVYVDPLQPLIDKWILPKIKSMYTQRVLNYPQVTKVRDLKLTKGGYIGKAVIPTVSDFVGEDFEIDAFIPGSQIVLNITDDFESFEGQEVDTFIINQIIKPDPKKPGMNQMSLVCSVKEYLKFLGEHAMVDIFKEWCEDSELWRDTARMVYNGLVTGVINSSKRCGVFVEIPQLCITGMIPVKPDQLVNFKRGSEIYVNLTGFEEDTYYNPDMGQIQHKVPYIIKDNMLMECNIKPILKIADMI